MTIKEMIKYLFENKDATGYRKSSPNLRFDLKEKGYASANITDPDKKPSENINDYFLRKIDGNCVTGVVVPTLADYLSDDFEIEVQLEIGDKVKIYDFPKLTIEHIKSVSNDANATFKGITSKNLRDYYLFEVTVKDSMIEQFGRINIFLVSPSDFINRKL